MSKYYAFGNGSFGCLYDHVDGPFVSQEKAADVAADLFDLEDGGREELARNGYLNLIDYRETFIDLEDAGGEGADYIEVFEVVENWSAACDMCAGMLDSSGTTCAHEYNERCEPDPRDRPTVRPPAAWSPKDAWETARAANEPWRASLRARRVALRALEPDDTRPTIPVPAHVAAGGKVAK